MTSQLRQEKTSGEAKLTKKFLLVTPWTCIIGSRTIRYTKFDSSSGFNCCYNNWWIIINIKSDLQGCLEVQETGNLVDKLRGHYHQSQVFMPHKLPESWECDFFLDCPMCTQLAILELCRELVWISDFNQSINLTPMPHNRSHSDWSLDQVWHF